MQQQLSWNQAWEDICVNPHQAELEEGQRQGQADGRRAGYQEGYRLGSITALDYGVELGFVQGVLQELVRHIPDRSNSIGHDGHLLFAAEKRDKIVKSISILQTCLDEFPSSDAIFQSSQNGAAQAHTQHITASDNQADQESNDTSTSSTMASLDVAAKMQSIRARFKLLLVQLGLSHLSLPQIMNAAATIGLVNTPNNATNTTETSIPTAATSLEPPTTEW
jgi:hypothetical protein